MVTLVHVYSGLANMWLLVQVFALSAVAQEYSQGRLTKLIGEKISCTDNLLSGDLMTF